MADELRINVSADMSSLISGLQEVSGQMELFGTELLSTTDNFAAADAAVREYQASLSGSVSAFEQQMTATLAANAANVASAQAALVAAAAVNSQSEAFNSSIAAAEAEAAALINVVRAFQNSTASAFELSLAQKTAAQSGLTYDSALAIVAASTSNLVTANIQAAASYADLNAAEAVGAAVAAQTVATTNAATDATINKTAAQVADAQATATSTEYYNALDERINNLNEAYNQGTIKQQAYVTEKAAIARQARLNELALTGEAGALTVVEKTSKGAAVATKEVGTAAEGTATKFTALQIAEARGAARMIAMELGMGRLAYVFGSLAGVIGPVTAAMSAVFVPILAVTAIYVVDMMIEKYHQLEDTIRKSVIALEDFAGEQSNAAEQTEITTLKLQDQLSELNGGLAHNKVKEALLEADEAAQKLLGSLNKNLEKLMELQKANLVGMFQSIATGHHETAFAGAPIGDSKEVRTAQERLSSALSAETLASGSLNAANSRVTQLEALIADKSVANSKARIAALAEIESARKEQAFAKKNYEPLRQDAADATTNFSNVNQTAKDHLATAKDKATAETKNQLLMSQPFDKLNDPSVRAKAEATASKKTDEDYKGETVAAETNDAFLQTARIQLTNQPINANLQEQVAQKTQDKEAGTKAFEKAESTRQANELIANAQNEADKKAIELQRAQSLLEARLAQESGEYVGQAKVRIAEQTKDIQLAQINDTTLDRVAAHQKQFDTELANLETQKKDLETKQKTVPSQQNLDAIQKVEAQKQALQIKSESELLALVDKGYNDRLAVLGKYNAEVQKQQQKEVAEEVRLFKESISANAEAAKEEESASLKRIEREAKEREKNISFNSKEQIYTPKQTLAAETSSISTEKTQGDDASDKEIKALQAQLAIAQQKYNENIAGAHGGGTSEQQVQFKAADEALKKLTLDLKKAEDAQKAFDDSMGDKQTDATRQYFQNLLNGWHQYIDQVTTALTTGLNGWMQGTERFGQAMAKMWNKMVMDAVNALEKIAAKWLVHELMITVAHAAGVATRQGTDNLADSAILAKLIAKLGWHVTHEAAKTAVSTTAKGVDVATTATAEAAKVAITKAAGAVTRLDHAKDWATGAGSAVANIPIIGPILAPIAAAAAFAVAMAFDNGGIMPHTGMALVHQSEGVLTGPTTKMLQHVNNAVNNNSLSNKGGTTNHISMPITVNGATDAKAVGDQIMTRIQRHFRTNGVFA